MENREDKEDIAKMSAIQDAMASIDRFNRVNGNGYTENGEKIVGPEGGGVDDDADTETVRVEELQQAKEDAFNEKFIELRSSEMHLTTILLAQAKVDRKKIKEEKDALDARVAAGENVSEEEKTAMHRKHRRAQIRFAQAGFLELEVKYASPADRFDVAGRISEETEKEWFKQNLVDEATKLTQYDRQGNKKGKISSSSTEATASTSVVDAVNGEEEQGDTDDRNHASLQDMVDQGLVVIEKKATEEKKVENNDVATKETEEEDSGERTD